MSLGGRAQDQNPTATEIAIQNVSLIQGIRNFFNRLYSYKINKK